MRTMKIYLHWIGILTMITIRQLCKEGQELLESNDIPDADIDARRLIEYLLGITSREYYCQFDREVDEDTYNQYIKLIVKRATHYPLQYIIGTQEFMGLQFEVNEDVLIPRWETELLVEEVLKICDKRDSVLDMCTGSGCIITSIKRLGKVNKAVGVDISEVAIEVSKRNAKKNEVDVDFVVSDLFDNVLGTYDIIVSNPPYIKTKVIEGLMPEVRRFEPMMALDGKEDGLYFYNRIIDASLDYLKPNGHIFFEIGFDQAKDVAKLLIKNNFEDIRVIKDYAGHDRIVKARRG